MASVPDFVVIGHVTKDLINRGFRPGGSVLYSALTARNLGCRARMVTRAGPDIDLAALTQGIELRLLSSNKTTTFRNIYRASSRAQYVHEVSEKISVKDVPAEWHSTRMVHLAPVAQEIEEIMLGLFPDAVKLVTPQGWLRRWDQTGRVSVQVWENARIALALTDVLIVSENELSPNRAVIEEFSEKVVVIVTQGRRGASLLWKSRSINLPAYEVEEIDPTGAGDVFAAAFLIEYYRSGEPLSAVKWANCAASFVVEKIGVEGIPTREQVEERLRGWKV